MNDFNKVGLAKTQDSQGLSFFLMRNIRVTYVGKVNIYIDET